MDLLQNNRKCSLCTQSYNILWVKSDVTACRSYNGKQKHFQFGKYSISNLKQERTFERTLSKELLKLKSLYLTFKTIGYTGLKYDVNSESCFYSSSFDQYSDLQNRKMVLQAKTVSILKKTSNLSHLQINQQIYPVKLNQLVLTNKSLKFSKY
ncbi:Hypothetical_protein [Hexamita inflata]|uniref:Hypothetical_protein n=1 Tax=Hexamita inflata TaxID=28002 RepID=A0ABP1HFZ6_9EUKA